MSKKYNVKNIKRKKDHLSIHWSDNHKSKFHFLWLRDNCPSAIHPTANMRIFNLLTVTKNIFPKKLIHKNNKIKIYWSELNHESNFDTKWLRDHCYSLRGNNKYKSSYYFWDQKLLLRYQIFEEHLIPMILNILKLKKKFFLNLMKQV